MKIAIVLFQKDRGGVDSYLKTLISNWPEEDQISLITNNSNRGIEVLDKLIEKRKIDVIFTKAFDLNAGFFQKIVRFINLPIYIHFLSLRYRWLLHNFSDHKIMVQNGTYPGSLDGLAFLKASFDFNIEKRMMVVHHGAVHGRMRRMFFSGWVDLFVHSWASDLVTVSRATRRTLIDYFGFDPSLNPIRVVHNSVVVNDRVNFDGKLSESHSELKFGIVGRVERYKGHEDLVMALGLLEEKSRKKIAIHIIGEGHPNEISRLKRLAESIGVSKNLIFEGFVNGEPIDIISELDLLFMLTKDFEGFGLTIAESMSAGTPVVTTKVGAVDEFTDDSTVTYVEVESPRDIARTIENFLADKGSFDSKCQLAKLKISEYKPEDMVESYRTLLEV